jgi:hypothetical protein
MKYSLAECILILDDCGKFGIRAEGALDCGSLLPPS